MNLFGWIIIEPFINPQLFEESTTSKRGFLLEELDRAGLSNIIYGKFLNGTYVISIALETHVSMEQNIRNFYTFISQNSFGAIGILYCYYEKLHEPQVYRLVDGRFDSIAVNE